MQCIEFEIRKDSSEGIADGYSGTLVKNRDIEAIGDNMAKGGHSHRSTLKNDHKPFKSKHASKGQLKNQNKGKVEKSTGGSSKTNKVVSKRERMNAARQVKENKILETKTARKLFEGTLGAEKIVTVITLTKDISSLDIASRLVNCVKDDDSEALELSTPSVTNTRVGRFKTNLKIVIPDQTNFLSILDAAKVSDYVVVGISAQEEVEQEYGERILRAVIAQGIASVIGVLPNVVAAYPKKNLQLDIRQSLYSYFSHFFPNEEKLFALEYDTECSNCVRTICQKFPKSITWRDSRGYVLADSASWAQSESDPTSGHLVVEGTVRGIGFNANRLVHIPGFGDFQVDRIEKLNPRPAKQHGMQIDSDENNIFIPNENQESLETLNPEEIDMSDDGWEEDDAELGARMDGKHYFEDGSDDRFGQRKKLPKGTSKYQSRWLLDDVLENASDLESDHEEDIDIDIENTNNDEDMQIEDGQSEYAPTEAGDNQSEMFVDLPVEEEHRQLQEFRELAKDDLEFPDELELDPSESGKQRLAAYRGIKSLANCNWDYDEHDLEAPSIWKRLLRISNFKATKNKVCKDAIKDAQINIGSKARIFIKAPAYIMEKINCQAEPFTVYGLLEHEHKLGVVNFSFESWEDYDTPIPTKDTLIAQYGPRRQVIQPLFNQASNNANNVHKSENFVHQGNVSIATCIAPPLFSNAPTIFFKPSSDGSLELVGQGTFLNCDHSRIVAERAVLTGHPVKIHKRVVTIRYMFFNAEDINWFKAIPLFTKLGRSGFIKESLGTHGYFKATFDGKLSAQDVVAMSMYKRVWPEISTGWNE